MSNLTKNPEQGTIVSSPVLLLYVFTLSTPIGPGSPFILLVS